MPKMYSDSYIYKQFPAYEKEMLGFILNAQVLDTNSTAFENIIFDIKRRNISKKLVDVLKSKNTVLCIGNKTLPKAFKTFVSADPKNHTAPPKLYIDCTDLIELKNGEYVCKNIDWLISYLISGMTALIYRVKENMLTGNQSIVKDGAEAWSALFTYIIDRIYKISSVQNMKKRITYIGAIYYLVNIIGKDLEKSSDSIKAIATKVAKIESRDAAIVDMQIAPEDFVNIDTFITKVTKIFDLTDFKTNIFIEKWMTSFGTGTVFGMEFLPAFATMLTDSYVGGYINQQMTIEKATGSSMVTVSKTVLEIGERV